jgi:hypothetical protein
MLLGRHARDDRSLSLGDDAKADERRIKAPQTIETDEADHRRHMTALPWGAEIGASALIHERTQTLRRGASASKPWADS